MLLKARKCWKTSILHKQISLKLNIDHFEPYNVDGATNNLLKIPKNAQLTPFSNLKMIPQKLNNFYKPFGRYITSKVTFTPKYNYLSSYFCLRNCDSAELAPLEGYGEIYMSRLGQNLIFTFFNLQNLAVPQTISEKCVINSFFESQRWSPQNWTISMSFWAPIKVAVFGCIFAHVWCRCCRNLSTVATSHVTGLSSLVASSWPLPKTTTQPPRVLIPAASVNHLR